MISRRDGKAMADDSSGIKFDRILKNTDECQENNLDSDGSRDP